MTTITVSVIIAAALSWYLLSRIGFFIGWIVFTGKKYSDCHSYGTPPPGFIIAPIVGEIIGGIIIVAIVFTTIYSLNESAQDRIVAWLKRRKQRKEEKAIAAKYEIAALKTLLSKDPQSIENLRRAIAEIEGLTSETSTPDGIPNYRYLQGGKPRDPEHW